MTRYPVEIDSALNIPQVVDNFSAINAITVNRLRDAIIAVEQTLGVKPAGTYATVRARLDFLEANIGSGGGGDGYDIVPGGINGAVQFNNFGSFDGASHASVSSDGYLQLGKNTYATTGDLRFSNNFQISGRKIDSVQDINALTLTTIGEAQELYLGLGLDAPSYTFNQNATVLNLYLGSRQYSNLRTMDSSNATTAQIAVLSADIAIDPSVSIYPNIYFSGTNPRAPFTTESPFNGGKGIVLIKDLDTLASDSPLDGFYLWSDPTTHHPIIQLPNSSVYDLISSNSPVGNNKSIQFNDNGVFGGASFASISSDGYLEVSEDGGPVASKGTIRVSKSFNLYARTSDNNDNFGVIGTNFSIRGTGAIQNVVDIGWNGTRFDQEIADNVHIAAKQNVISRAFSLDGYLTSAISIWGPNQILSGAGQNLRSVNIEPNLWINSPVSNAITYDPFGAGLGYALWQDRTTAATGNPTNGFWLWSNPANHHPTIQLPNGNSYDLLAATAPGGNDRSVQFNNNAGLDGANHVSIASDGYLQISNDRAGGSAQSGDIRLAKDASISIRSNDGTKDVNLLKTISGNFGASSTIKSAAFIGGYGATIDNTNFYDDIETYVNLYTGIAVRGLAWSGDYPAGLAAFSSGTYHGSTTNPGVSIWGNLVVGGTRVLTALNPSGDDQPFRDGYGILLVKDVVSIPTIAPTAGFDLWSDSTTHHPTVKLPNGNIYDLISSNSPNGNNRSVQFNNSGIFDGATHSSISSDGYLQISNDRGVGSAQRGDIRLSSSSSIWTRRADNSSDVNLLKHTSNGPYNIRQVLTLGGGDGYLGDLSTYLDSVESYSTKFAGMIVTGSPFDLNGDYIAGIGIYGPNAFSDTDSSHGAFIWNNLVIGPKHSFLPKSGNQPFRDGYGIILVKDRQVATTSAPTGGFDLWSDLTSHKPNIQTPDGKTYDLTDGYPGGSLNSVQYNNGFKLAGASRTSISSDGYLVINGDGYARDLTVGDIRLANKSSICAKNHDGSKDIQILKKSYYNITSGADVPNYQNYVSIGDIIYPGTLSPDLLTLAVNNFMTFKLDGYKDGSNYQSIQFGRFNSDDNPPNTYIPDPQALFGIGHRINTSFAHDNDSVTYSDFGGGKGVIYIGPATTNPSTNPSNGNILYSDTSDGYLKYRQASGNVVTLYGGGSSGTGFTAGGDLTGSNSSQTVAKINGASVPAAGSLTTGHVLQTNGSSSTTYGFVTNSNVDPTAAIAGTKISPDFGSQNIKTTGYTQLDGYVRLGFGTGTSPAAIGALRFSNLATSTLMAVGDGTTDYKIAEYDATFTRLRLGPLTGLQTQFQGSIVYVASAGNVTATFASNQIDLSPLGTSKLTLTTSLMTSVNPIAFGSTTAASGQLRFANNSGTVLAQRNAANSADLILLAANTADGYLGSDTSKSNNLSNLHIVPTTSTNIYAGSTQLVSFTSSLNTFANPIAIGATPATTGYIRVPYQTGSLLETKDSGGNNRDIIYQNGNAVIFGDINLTAVTLAASTGATIQAPTVNLSASGAVRFSITSTGAQFGTPASLGGGIGVIGIANAGTNPTTNPTGGLVAYVDAADGYFKTRTKDGYVIALNGAGGGGGGGGLTSSQHNSLRQLIHLADIGPTNGFASGAYREMSPVGAFPTSIIWWVDNSKTAKIISKDITYNENNLTTQIVLKAYDTDGSTVLETLTDDITYSGVFESSRTRTLS